MCHTERFLTERKRPLEVGDRVRLNLSTGGEGNGCPDVGDLDPDIEGTIHALDTLSGYGWEEQYAAVRWDGNGDIPTETCCDYAASDLILLLSEGSA